MFPSLYFLWQPQAGLSCRIIDVILSANCPAGLRLWNQRTASPLRLKGGLRSLGFKFRLQSILELAQHPSLFQEGMALPPSNQEAGDREWVNQRLTAVDFVLKGPCSHGVSRVDSLRWHLSTGTGG